MEALLVLEQGCLEELFLVVSSVVGIMEMDVEMEGEEDKLMALIPSSLVLSLEEDQEAATVEGGEDKHQGKINQEQGSLDWVTFLVEGTITAVIVLHNTTTIIMVDTTVDTTMDTIMATITGTTMVEVDTTVDTTSPSSKGASATTA